MKKKQTEKFCIACEDRILSHREEFGPICPNCYKKTRRKDPLMKAAIQRRLVALVPSLCPHEEGCKFDRMPPRYFNIIVFDERLEPIKVEGPYPKRVAEQEAKYIQEKIDRRRKRGK
jgi:hypothetical protein